jgi:putative ABC transport system ATP-binding protein
MLKIEGARKHYKHRGQIVAAMDDMTLEVPKGDFIALVGPSGSGKSTLLLTLGGMLSPTEGKVYLDGVSLYDIVPDARAKVRREKIGFVFQTFNLIPYLTALENVQVPLLLSGVNEESQKMHAVALLERVGLADRLDHKPSELSVGQQQRVALARMLVNDPTLVLADEPTGNLDPDTSRQIMAFLEEINQEGRTVVMVTHDPNAAAKAKRTLRLEAGRIVNGHVAETNPLIAMG